MVRKEEKGSETVEHGDLFFFYRPKIESREVQDIEDVQRFYMVTSPEWNGRVTDTPDRKELHRLFLLGQNDYQKSLRVNQLRKNGIGL